MSLGPCPTSAATTGAPIANSVMIAMITIPARAKRSRRKRRQNSSHGLRPAIWALGAPPTSGGCSPTIGSVAIWVKRRLRPPPRERYYGGPQSSATDLRREFLPPQKGHEARQDVDPPDRADGAVGGGPLAEGGDPIGPNPGPGHEQWDRIGRVSLPEARGGVIRGDGQEHPGRIDRGEDLSEEGPVDHLDHLALVLGPAVVGRDVRPLD